MSPDTWIFGYHQPMMHFYTYLCLRILRYLATISLWLISMSPVTWIFGYHQPVMYFCACLCLQILGCLAAISLWLISMSPDTWIFIYVSAANHSPSLAMWLLAGSFRWTTVYKACTTPLFVSLCPQLLLTTSAPLSFKVIKIFLVHLNTTLCGLFFELCSVHLTFLSWVCATLKFYMDFIWTLLGALELFKLNLCYSETPKYYMDCSEFLNSFLDPTLLTDTFTTQCRFF